MAIWNDDPDRGTSKVAVSVCQFTALKGPGSPPWAMLTDVGRTWPRPVSLVSRAAMSSACRPARARARGRRVRQAGRHSRWREPPRPDSGRAGSLGHAWAPEGWYHGKRLPAYRPARSWPGPVRPRSRRTSSLAQHDHSGPVAVSDAGPAFRHPADA